MPLIKLKPMITTEFKRKIVEAALAARNNYSGSDAAFSKMLSINPSVFSRLKNGETEKVLSDAQWLSIGRRYNVSIKQNTWKIARTEVYNEIEDNLNFCKQNSKAMILVDTWGIGKSESSKHIVKQMQDAFYLDCSQCKTKTEFIRSLAETIGLDNKGRYRDVKADVKYYLSNVLAEPLVVLDDAGDLEYPAFLELKELWNGTENLCGWYMIGDDSLESKIKKGIEKKKVGYGAIFSRFSDECISLVPIDIEQRKQFQTKLIGDVANVNAKNKADIPKYIKKCLAKGKTLRHLKTLIQLSA